MGNGQRVWNICPFQREHIALTSVDVNELRTVGVGPGIFLDNHWLNANISLNKVNVIHSAGAGIEIVSNGALIFKGGEIGRNEDGGIVLNRTALYSTTTVTLSDLYIHDNTGYGMQVHTNGAITLTNVRSNSNTTWGMTLDNTACGTATPCNVSLLTSGSGVNEFHSNGNWGLVINTYGVVVLRQGQLSPTTVVMVCPLPTNAATIPANVTITGGKFNQ